MNNNIKVTEDNGYITILDRRGYEETGMATDLSFNRETAEYIKQRLEEILDGN